MAGIIRTGRRSAPPVAEAATTYQFEDISQSYLSRVRHEAESIIALARAEASRIKTQAADEGKQAALQAVEANLRARIDQQLTSVMAAMQRAVEGVAQSRQVWQKRWEEHGIRVAVAIASRVIRRQMRESPEVALDLLREALSLSAGSQRLIVRLNPADHAALRDQAERITSQLSQVATTEIIADPAVSPGGCLVETESGSVDSQIETQLARILEELLA